MEEFKYLGIWWLSDTPNKQVGGTLEFSFKSGLQLQLIGTLDDFFDKSGNGKNAKVIGGSDKYYQIIHGSTINKSHEITLLYCYQNGYSINIPGIIAESINPRFVLLGKHFNKIDDIKFFNVHVDYSGLSDWVTSTGHQLSLPKYDSSKIFFENYQLKYVHPENIEAKFNDTDISIYYNLSAPIFVKREMVLNESVLMKIENKKLLDINEWLNKYILPLRDFFSLSTAIPNDIVNISFCNEDSNDSTKLLFAQKIFLYDKSKANYLNRILFLSEDVKSFSTCFEKWFIFYKTYQNVCNLYFNIITSPELDQKNQFLNLMQAIEIYHRIKYIITQSAKQVDNTILN